MCTCDKVCKNDAVLVDLGCSDILCFLVTHRTPSPVLCTIIAYGIKKVWSCETI